MTVTQEHAYLITCDDPMCASRNGAVATERVWAATETEALDQLPKWTGTQLLRCGSCSLRTKLEATRGRL